MRKTLKRLRVESGKTQEELGTILNVRHSSISAYESGKTMVPPETLLTYGWYFGRPMNFFFSEDTEENANLEIIDLSKKDMDMIKRYHEADEEVRTMIQSLLSYGEKGKKKPKKHRENKAYMVADEPFEDTNEDKKKK